MAMRCSAASGRRPALTAKGSDENDPVMQLHGRRCTVDAPGVAGDYATQLLTDLGAAVTRNRSALATPAADAAPASAFAALSGPADGPPVRVPLPLPALADGVLAALQALAPEAALDDLDGDTLLSERAVLAGLRRNGAIAPGGHCRLLAAADGHIALSLARDDDWHLLPAWLEQDCVAPGDWAALAACVQAYPTNRLIEQGRLLGLALAADQACPSTPVPWLRVHAQAPATARPLPARRTPLVVDLSSLWAGPLCSRLLQRLGARVIKLESLGRPDGARTGHAAFFDRLHAGKQSVALDFTTATGRAQLRALLAEADIIIEASRPRALRQLGIDAEAIIAGPRRPTWIALSGHGRGEPQEHWIAYGDDAGVAAGLTALLHRQCGQHLFVGDAIGDPMTGLHAALAAWASWRSGGGRLIALSLVEVLQHLIQQAAGAQAPIAARKRGCSSVDSRIGARELGADTAAVLAEFGLR